MYINPNKIIVPEKYCGHPNTGFDISLIGFEHTEDIEILEKYFESLEITKNLKSPFFEEKKVNDFK